VLTLQNELISDWSTSTFCDYRWWMSSGTTSCKLISHLPCSPHRVQVKIFHTGVCASHRFWLFVTYPGSSLASVEPFVCQQIYKDNYLIASWDECPYGKDGWKPLAGVSLLFIFVYPRECHKARLIHVLQILYSGNRPHLAQKEASSPTNFITTFAC